jgi:stearoyl-CoA desaturase (delta-9 desaturase)
MPPSADLPSDRITSPGSVAGELHDDINYPGAVPFVLVHLSAIAAVWSGVTWEAIGIGVGLYWLRMFAIVAGYHRYFSHRSYSTSRVFQFFLAFLAQSSAQRSVLWWAAKHRQHHLHSDTSDDTHSPRHRGFLFSHVGWIFARRHAKPDLVRMADFSRYPELMWLHKYELLPAIALAALCFVFAGWPGLVVGFVWSTVALYHATFCINSLAHVHGRKRYVTGDDSRNNWLLAVLTLGEGWHNNHHAYQSSVRQGFRWWEVDPAYYVLRALSWVGLVWDLKTPPEDVLRNEHRLGSRVVSRAAEELVVHLNPESIAHAVISTFHGATLTALQQRLVRAQHDAAELLRDFHLPAMPTREQVRAEARAIFATTRSLDQIVDRGYELLLAAVGARISAQIR